MYHDITIVYVPIFHFHLAFGYFAHPVFHITQFLCMLHDLLVFFSISEWY
jgi:hypothetical protein